MLNNYSDSEQVSLEPHRRNVCICHKSPFDDAMTLKTFSAMATHMLITYAKFN